MAEAATKIDAELIYEASLPKTLPEQTRLRLKARILAIHGDLLTAQPERVQDAADHWTFDWGPHRNRAVWDAYDAFAEDLLDHLRGEGREPELILNELIPSLVSDAAIEMGWNPWFRGTRERDRRKVPYARAHKFGNHWVQDGHPDRVRRQLAGVIAKWQAKVLEEQAKLPPEQSQTNKKQPDILDLRDPKERAAERQPCLETFCQENNCFEADVYRAATVNPTEGKKWKKGELSDSAAASERIEKVLSGTLPRLCEKSATARRESVNWLRVPHGGW